jgi:UDP-N-acetylglucosamine diphosphorylase/glucosamine-1-phosphate N-acetyltransferase
MPQAPAPLILFEPATTRWLGPLVRTRAVWDLRVGAASLRERLEAEQAGLGVAPAFWTRPELRPLYPPPAASHFDAKAVILLAGHQPLASAARLAELGEGDSLLADGELLAARVSGKRAREFLAALGEDAPSPRASASPRQGPLGPILSYWWEIAEMATGALLADLDGLRARGPWRSPRRSDWPGSRDVHLAAGVQIHPGAVLDASAGPLVLDREVAVGAGSVLQGPGYLGPGTRIKPLSQILHGCYAGPQCRLGGEIEDCQLQGYANKQHHGFLGHAVLGEWVNLGAGTSNSDLKNNYSLIRVRQAGGELETARRFVGCCLGDHVKTAIQSRLNTGSVLEPFVNWTGGGFPPKYLPPCVWAGDDGLEAYDLERALATARVVMARRDQTLDAGREAVYRALFEAQRRPLS